MVEGKQKNIIVQWIVWHFSKMPSFLFSIWKNYILFSLDFFSAPLLLKTLFSPWKKYSWSYPRGFNFIGYANTFISNFFSRIIGAICRTFLIIFSFIVLAVILVIGALVILFWVLIPFIIIGLMVVFYGI